MSDLVLSRLRASVVFAAPVVLLIGMIVSPYVSDQSSVGFAEAALADPDRWAWGNAIVGLGLVLVMLAAVGIRTYLRDAGEERWSPFALAALVVGHGLVLFTIGLDAFARVGLADGGLALEAEVEGLAAYGTIEAIGGLLMPLGWIALTVSIAVARVLPRAEVAMVATGLAAVLVGMFTPVGWATYAFAIGTLLVLAPIGRGLWIDADIQTHAPMAVPRLQVRAAAHGH